ncbi:MarR family transcriptional regulator [Paenibacillus hemerocallicola]|uniref:MarR family transcriptional regulator n=1 Tax=Paenibacillus hemerocallicola TaxID=1172614 RepID=A0A5C4TDK3_9BACL|nr:MarR family transcriptional regulator [Paenibacillus hemerocallicola]TNJ66932.1 MarR family transcriptional regulator [Paenibacillus hemerocallicola]
MGADSQGYVDRFHSAMESFKRKIVQEFSGRLQYGLTMPQFFMLHMIRDKGPCKATALAEQMEVKPSAITVMIDRLVNHGFVERSHDERDRRIVLIRLTEQGKQALVQMNQIRAEIASRYFDKIDKDEAEQFLNILEKLAK